MRLFQRLLTPVIALALLCQTGITQTRVPNSKEIKIRGYITSFTSPTSFEIEDYRISRDASLQVEFENQTTGTLPILTDLRVGTLVELLGQFNEATNELKATQIKVDLKQFRNLNVTTVLDRKPTEMMKVEGDRWRGIVIADGRRLRIEPESQVFFRLNRTEKKEAQKQAKEQQASRKVVKDVPTTTANNSTTPSPTQIDKPTQSEKPDSDDETTAEQEAVGAGPLNSLADIGPGVFMTYEGREQADGTVLVTKVTFVRNELEKGERDLWKKLKAKEKAANFVSGKPGELKVGRDKYKVLPNQAVQDYVTRIGQSLIPLYQRNLADGDPEKIPFRFVVIIRKGFNATAYPNGVVVIHDDVFKVLENEAQLAAIIGHEIAHITQEHIYRELEHNKKRRMALAIAAIATGYGMGYWGMALVLDLIGVAMTNGYSRTMENQADRIGLQYLVDAGYDPREAPRVWKLVSKLHTDSPTEFFWSTHDSNTERRSFEMLTIKNSFSNVDFAQLKINEEEFKHVAAVAVESTPKNKK